MGIAIVGAGNGYPPLELPGDHRNQSNQPARVDTAQAAAQVAERRRAVNAEIGATASDLEKISLAFNKKLRFVVNEELDQVVVKVIDPETDKVIKELPPEELQRLPLKIKEMIGLLFDETV